MRRLLIVIVFFVPLSLLFSQEIRVVRGKSREFPKQYRGRSEGNGIFFGMSDLPPGRVVTLANPGFSSNVSEKARRRAAQVLIVKQIPSRGRLRSSEVVISPRGADYFNIKSNTFLVTDNSSVRWADRIPPVFGSDQSESSKRKESGNQLFEDSVFSDNETDYVLEPSDVRSPENTVGIDDVVDDFESFSGLKMKDSHISPTQRIEIDVNVGVSNKDDHFLEPEPLSPQKSVRGAELQLQSKMVDFVPPGTYMQLGYYAERASLLRMLSRVGSQFDVKIVPEAEAKDGNRRYRFLIGDFQEHELLSIKENLYKLGLDDFFSVKY